MVAIDIAFFPHIFDTIFKAADFHALLRLRTTCRALRDRINDEWGYLTWFITKQGRLRQSMAETSLCPATRRA